MLRFRLPLIFVAIAALCLMGGAAWGWVAMARDLGREGELAGFVGCIMGPNPNADWGHGARRSFVWAALSAPEWMMGAEPGEVREGAELVLRRSCESADAERVIGLACAGRMDARAAGAHLGLAWLAQGESFRARASELLDGDAREQALALLAVPVTTGWRFEDVALYEERWSLSDPDAERRLERTFGTPRTDLLAECRAWLADHEGARIAEMHRELLVRLWSADVPDLGRVEPAARVGGSFAFWGSSAWLQQAAGEPVRDMSQNDWYADQGVRRAAIDRLRAQAPVALHASTLREQIHFSYNAWQW